MSQTIETKKYLIYSANSDHVIHLFEDLKKEYKNSIYTFINHENEKEIDILQGDTLYKYYWFRGIRGRRFEDLEAVYVDSLFYNSNSYNYHITTLGWPTPESICSDTRFF